MAQFTAADTVTGFRDTTGGRAVVVRRVERLLIGNASAGLVFLLAGVPVLLSLWLLLAPERVFSREMTWDLMFNLAGAWRIQNGHVPNVDFHDPVGPLGFWLTYLGFSAVGPGPRAFLVGQAIFLVFAFATALIAACRRLPTVPAVLFVLYGSLLVAMPVNIGAMPNAYTFAMSYNRWGWSTLATLCLLLFLPPRSQRLVWLDVITGGLLLVAMFYLKVTFAVAGAGVVMVALLLSPHVREQWRWWVLALTLALGNAFAPHNQAYLTDIVEATGGGLLRPPLDHLRLFLASNAEYALYGAAVLLLLWMWRYGQAGFQYVMFAALVPCVGTFVVSQSNQTGTLPLGTVIAYLIYHVLRNDRRIMTTFRGAEVLLLVAVLLLPALSVASAMSTVGGYHVVAKRDTGMLAVQATNLRGLAVPQEEDYATPILANLAFPHRLLSSSLQHSPKHQISDRQYVQTLIEAASLFADGRRAPVRIVVLDQVNPMPFMLGYPPPHGGYLWLWPDMPPRPADEFFGDADVVLIPKFSTYSRTTLTALETYDDYLANTFPVREESPSWTILSRRREALRGAPDVP